MPTVTCPACAAQISDQAATCTDCGKPLAPPIRRIGSKLQGSGVLVTAQPGALPGVFYPEEELRATPANWGLTPLALAVATRNR